MKLQVQQIEMIAYSVLKKLVDEGAASVDSVDESAQRVMRSITDDLQVEDRLNEEVRGILSQHELEMRDRGIQYSDMFKAVKQKLVKERKLIL